MGPFGLSEEQIIKMVLPALKKYLKVTSFLEPGENGGLVVTTQVVVDNVLVSNTASKVDIGAVDAILRASVSLSTSD